MFLKMSCLHLDAWAVQITLQQKLQKSRKSSSLCFLLETMVQMNIPSQSYDILDLDARSCFRTMFLHFDIQYPEEELPEG